VKCVLKLVKIFLLHRIVDVWWWLAYRSSVKVLVRN